MFFICMIYLCRETFSNGFQDSKLVNEGVSISMVNNCSSTTTQCGFVNEDQDMDAANSLVFPVKYKNNVKSVFPIL